MALCELCDARIKKGKVYCPNCEDGLAENEAADKRDAAAPAPASTPAPAAGVIDLSPAAEASAFLAKTFGW